MARDTIVQRISLDGDADIRARLQQLAKDGKASFEEIQAAIVKIDFASFTDGIDRTLSSLATVAERSALAFSALHAAAGTVSAAIFAFAKSSANAADNMEKQAEAAGVAVEAYSGLAFAAEAGNVSADTLSTSMARLNRNIVKAATESGKAVKGLGTSIQQGLGSANNTFGDLGITVVHLRDDVAKAAQGTKATQNAFAQFGIAVRNANGQVRPVTDILGDIADLFQKMPDGAQKSAAAVAFFGQSGTRLIPILNGGRQALAQYSAQALASGKIVTKEAAAMGAAMNDSLTRLSASIGGTKDAIGRVFQPAITDAANAFADAVDASRAAIQRFTMQGLLQALIIVRDFERALSGREADVLNPWVVTWTHAIEDFGSAVVAVTNNVVLPLFKAIGKAGELAAEGINAVFGTKITGMEVLVTGAILRILGVFRLVAEVARTAALGVRLLASALALVGGGSIIGGITAAFGALVEGATAFAGFIAAIVGWPALLVAGVVAAGVAVYAFWDDITAAASKAVDIITNVFSAENIAAALSGLADLGVAIGKGLVDALAAQLRLVGTIIAGVAKAIVVAFQGALNFIAGFFAGIVQEAGQLVPGLGTIWSTISGAASQAFTAIIQGANTVATQVVFALIRLAPSLAPTWAAIQQAGGGAFDFIVQTAAGLAQRIAAVFVAGQQIVATAVGAVANAAFQAWTSATNGILTAAQAIKDAIVTAQQAAGDVAGAERIAEALAQPFVDAKGMIATVFDDINAIAASGLGNVLSTIQSAGASIRAEISSILAALQQAAQAAASLRAQANGGSSDSGSDFSFSIDGHADGGFIRGRGGPRTDSILARLSNGEYVINAAAVRKIGLPILHAINSMRDPFRHGFASGGLVDFSGVLPNLASLLSVPSYLRAFPTGFGIDTVQPVISGRAINLNLPGGQSFQMIADNNVAEKLASYLRGRSFASLGASPSWQGAR